MTKIDSLTDAEITFMKRMLPHFMAGKSAEDAARAVLEDDARIMNAATSGAGFMWMGDEKGDKFFDPNPAAKGIATHLSAVVYEKLRGRKAAELGLVA